MIIQIKIDIKCNRAIIKYYESYIVAILVVTVMYVCSRLAQEPLVQNQCSWLDLGPEINHLLLATCSVRMFIP